MPQCYVCKKETDSLQLLNGKGVCEECYKKSAQNFILICGICGHYRFAPRDERSVALVAHILGISKEFVLAKQPSIITILSGCIWCPVHLTVESLFRLAHVAPLETYEAIIARLEPTKLDQVILRILKADPSSIRPGLDEIIDKYIGKMTVLGLIDASLYFSRKKYTRIIKDMPRRKIRDLCIYFSDREDLKTFPDWIPEFLEEIC